MSAVSTQNSVTASTRNTLSYKLAEATRAGQALATGKAIQSASQDTTGLAIGSNLRSNYDTLNVVLTGIKQSQSMLYIAEQGLRSAYDTATQMTQVLAKAKLGFMNDDLIRTTLSPTYVALKAEIDRIANAVNFNNQTLLNGDRTNPNSTRYKASTVTQNTNPDWKSAQTSISIPVGTVISTDGLSVSIDGAAATTGIKIDADSASTAEVINVANYSNSGTKTALTDASFILRNVKVSWVSGGTAKEGRTDITITNQDLAINSTAIAQNMITGTMDDVTIAATPAGGKPVMLTNFRIKDTDGTYKRSNTTGATIGAGKELNLSGATGTIENVVQQYTLSGGRLGQTKFNFVTGTDLNNSVIQVEFPDITLSHLIPALTTANYTQDVAPATLTMLGSEAEADQDIALVQSLVNTLVVELGKVGAQQKRFLNMTNQLETQLEETFKAQGEILNTDIAKTTEDFARANLETVIAINMIKQLIDTSINNLRLFFN